MVHGSPLVYLRCFLFKQSYVVLVHLKLIGAHIRVAILSLSVENVWPSPNTWHFNTDQIEPRKRRSTEHFANWHSLEEFCDNWEPSNNCLCPDTTARVIPNIGKEAAENFCILFYSILRIVFVVIKNAKQFLLHSSRNCYVGVSGEHLRLSLLSSVETNCTCVQKHQTVNRKSL